MKIYLILILGFSMLFIACDATSLGFPQAISSECEARLLSELGDSFTVKYNNVNGVTKHGFVLAQNNMCPSEDTPECKKEALLEEWRMGGLAGENVNYLYADLKYKYDYTMRIGLEDGSILGKDHFVMIVTLMDTGRFFPEYWTKQEGRGIHGSLEIPIEKIDMEILECNFVSP